jgi:tetratricopeptide (TPR) repeat protein
MPLFRSPQLDSLEYLNWAQRIAEADFRWLEVPAHGPGYPYFLGGLLALFGGSLPAVSAMQAFMGAVVCVLVVRLGQVFFSRRVGVLAGFLLAINGPLIFLEVSILSEGLLIFLLMLALLCLARDAVSPARAAAAGLLLGFAALVRPTALLFLPVALAVVLAFPAQPHRAKSASLLALACLLTILPVTALNWQASHGVTLIQGYGGMNFYLGNAPGGSGLPTARVGETWDSLAGESERAGFLRPADQDRYYVRKAFQEIRSQPFLYAKLLASKLLWTFQAEEVRDTFSYWFFRRDSRLLRLLPGFGLLFPPALLGILVSLGRKPRPWLLLGFLLSAAAANILLVVGTRYRSPLLPALAIFASLGLWSLVDELREARWSRAALSTGVILAGAFLCHFRRHPESHNFAEEWTFTGSALSGEGRTEEALSAFQQALAENPSFGAAWEGIGTVFLNAGDLNRAQDALSRAVTNAPDFLRARYRLGLALERQGRLEQAAETFRRCQELWPGDPQSGEALGTVLLAQSKLEDAQRVFERVLTIDPQSFPAHLGLARVEGALGRTQEGIPEAQRAVELEPASFDAWFTLTMLSLDAARPDLAETALERAEALAPRSPQTQLARAMLDRLEKRPEESDRILRALLTGNPGYKPAIALLLKYAAEDGRLPEARRFLESLKSPGA